MIIVTIRKEMQISTQGNKGVQKCVNYIAGRTNLIIPL
jgi:hypothetical protein